MSNVKDKLGGHASSSPDARGMATTVGITPAKTHVVRNRSLKHCLVLKNIED